MATFVGKIPKSEIVGPKDMNVHHSDCLRVYMTEKNLSIIHHYMLGKLHENCMAPHVDLVLSLDERNDKGKLSGNFK